MLSYSSSAETRMPAVFPITNQTMKVVTNTHARIDTRPSNWAPSFASGFVKQTASRPHMPATPCTEIAPTGSSILNLVQQHDRTYDEQTAGSADERGGQRRRRQGFSRNRDEPGQGTVQGHREIGLAEPRA